MKPRYCSNMIPQGPSKPRGMDMMYCIDKAAKLLFRAGNRASSDCNVSIKMNGTKWFGSCFMVSGGEDTSTSQNAQFSIFLSLL
jgi:hypothetical protein